MVLKSEKDVKRKVKQLLDKYDWFWWCPAANAYGKSGVSDFCALKHGVFMVIETKFGSNGCTPLQKQFIESIWASKGQGFVVNDQNLDQLEIWLQRFDESVEAVASQGQMPNVAGAEMLDAVNAMLEGIR